jgi:hypothetical protein
MNSLQHLYPADNHWIAAGIPFPLHHSIALRSLLVVKPYSSAATYELADESIKVGECLLSIGAESFVFQFAVQKCKV